MRKAPANASPRFKARMAGFFYLLVFVIGIPSIVARRGLVMMDDAAATAAQLLAHENLFRLGVAGDLLIIASYVVVTALLYELFKPVNGSVSLIAAFLSLMGCAVQASACAFELFPFVVLGGGQGLSALKTEQLQALGYLSLSLYGPAYKIGLVFFGFYCLLIGCLILRSTFMPRIVGALMVVAGLAWLTFLTPLGKDLAPFTMAPGALGELVLTVWLLVKGVDVERWEEQARKAEGVSF
jgi:hypothetical protein